MGKTKKTESTQKPEKHQRYRILFKTKDTFYINLHATYCGDLAGSRLNLAMFTQANANYNVG